MPLQDDVLSLPRSQVEPRDPDGEGTVDRIDLESRKSVGLGGVSKLIVQRRIRLGQLSSSLVYM